MTREQLDRWVAKFVIAAAIVVWAFVIYKVFWLNVTLRSGEFEITLVGLAVGIVSALVVRKRKHPLLSAFGTLALFCVLTGCILLNPF